MNCDLENYNQTSASVASQILDQKVSIDLKIGLTAVRHIFQSIGPKKIKITPSFGTMETSVVTDIDFKSKFYNLQGIHINERKKNFYKLLKSASIETTEDQIDIQPRNYQEKCFYVDVLIHFRKVDKLIKILKEGNGVLTSKVLKQKWFFQEVFTNMSNEGIVNDFLPSLSFSLRMKVLKKLSLALPEEKMDKIFDLVLERYGLFIAQQFLFSCSKDKIIYVLRNNEICLQAEQLKRLLQKDVNLIKIYFEEFKKNTSTDFDNSDFISYMTWKHPKLYFEMGLNTKHQKDLGRLTTRAVLKNNRDDVLKDLNNSRWNKGVLVREFKDYEKEYLKVFFPDDINLLNYYSHSSVLLTLVSKYPIKRRWEALSHGFKSAYNKDITENLQLFDERLAKFFPLEIKQKWAEIRYSENEDLQYIKYFDPKKAFELLKNKINVTSDINQRGRFINELITVCHENKDYVTYGEVLKYICRRHRNEDKAVRDKIISHIEDNIDYNLVTEDIWKYINEIIDVQRVRDKLLSWASWDIIYEHLRFVYKKNVNVFGEAVTQYAKDCIRDDTTFRVWDIPSEIEGAIFKHIFKILPSLEIKNRRDTTCKLMRDIVDFNQAIRDDKKINTEFSNLCMDFNECLPIIELIKEVFEKKEPFSREDCEVVKHLMLYNYLYSENAVQIIDEDEIIKTIIAMCNNEAYEDILYQAIIDVAMKPKRNNCENKLLEYFFTHQNATWNNYSKKGAIEYFMKKEPDVIAKYFDTLLPIDVKNGFLDYDYDVIKKYSHLKLDEKVVKYFKDLVHLKSTYDNKAKLLLALSKLMDTKEFLEVVKEYTPESKKLDLDNEEQREVYKVQCKIAKYFTNLDDPVELAPVLMHYCEGDYLQSSLPALYKVVYGLNEEKVSFYLKILGARAMSTRKHSVFLALELLAVKEAINIYSDLSNKETNISAKKYLFSAILKYYLKNPFENILTMVFSNMAFINKDDSEMIQKLVEYAKKFPKNYKAKYVEKVWNYLDVLEQQEVKVTQYRNTLIYTINENAVSFMLNLSKRFSENIITTYFLSCTNDTLLKDSDSLDYFVINYLLAYLDEEHFRFIFNIVKSYKDSYWHGNDKKIIGYIFRFFSIAYGKFEKNNVEFLTLFSRFWKHTFTHEECFSEYVQLKIMLLYKENSNMELFAKEADKLFQEIIQEYGPCMNVLLVNIVNTFFSNIDTANDEDVFLSNFTFYLLKSNSSQFNCFTAYSILEDKYVAKKDIYFKVINSLQSIDSGITRIYCNLILNK